MIKLDYCFPSLIQNSRFYVMHRNYFTVRRVCCEKKLKCNLIYSYDKKSF